MKCINFVYFTYAFVLCVCFLFQFSICRLSDDEEEDEGEDDPQNSGLHVNDAYNVPDEQGRVVINIGHPEAEEDIFLAPQIARIIKPHQIGGVRFLFDNIIESVERFSTSTGFGCILAHSMGLGKTLQLVCFIDIFLRHTNSKTILCIMPINTLQNWLAEFNMWLPEDPDSSPLKAQGEVRPRNFKLFVLNDTHKTLNARSKIVLEWARSGGVLLIGYELYRLLSLKKVTKRRGRKAARDPEVEEREAEEHKKLLDEMHAALVKPGPDLVVCDEGHRIKNSHASISVALKQIRSKRRIVLTGYPLQNNLLEYWCMVDFVRPNYLGTKTEFSNMFERPIQNGQCIDSTPQDIKLMRYRAHVLHSLLLGFVQRRSHVVLQNSLPLKEEFVILVRMTSFQRKLYDVFMNEVVRTKAVPNPLKAFAVCCKIWNHPDVLYNFLKKREADLDIEEANEAAIDPTFEVANENAAANKTSRKKAPNKKTKKEIEKAIIKSEMKSNDSKPAASIPPNTATLTMKTDSDMTAMKDKELNDKLKTDKINESIANDTKSITSMSDPFSHTNKSAYGHPQSQSQAQMPPQAPSGGFMNPTPMNPSQYGQSPYNSITPQTPAAPYHSGYPYPGFQPDFNASYNNYNKYDSNYYNSYSHQAANPHGRYYWGQTQQQPPPRSNSMMPQNPFDYNAPTNDPTKSLQSEYGQPSWAMHNQQYYPNHVDYQSGAPYSGYGSDYHSMYNMPQSNANQQSQHNMSGNYPPSSMQSSYLSAPEPNNQWGNNATAASSSANQTAQSSNNSNNSNQMNFPVKNPNAASEVASNMNSGNNSSASNSQTSTDVNFTSTTNAHDDKNNFKLNNPVKSENIKIEASGSDTKNDSTDKGSDDKTNDDESDDKKLLDVKEEPCEKDAKVKDDGIPYDWAIELMKNYTPDLIENSTKMEIFFSILNQTINLNDRMLIFSQSLLTLNLIERFLQANPTKYTNGDEIKWAKNVNYYRKLHSNSYYNFFMQTLNEKITNFSF